MSTPPSNDTLVALFKDKNDYLIARDQGWYRIPTNVRVPDIVRNGSIQYIAFYYKKLFGDWKYSLFVIMSLLQA